MAIITPSIYHPSVMSSTINVVYMDMLAGDTGLQFGYSQFQQSTVQISGTFAGATVLVEGSADGVAWNILSLSNGGGGGGGGGTATTTVDNFAGDGVTVTFPLSVAPASENDTDVYISGVYQNKTEYSIAGNSITFNSAPPVPFSPSDNIEVNSTIYSGGGGGGSNAASFTVPGIGYIIENPTFMRARVVGGAGGTLINASFTKVRS